MWYHDDPMITELRQIKIRLWERSGHDLHRMAQDMEQKARVAMLRRGEVSQNQATSAPKTGDN